MEGVQVVGNSQCSVAFREQYSLQMSLEQTELAVSLVPAYAISRLQFALNAAARLVFSLQKYDSVTLLLQELHWLKVEQRIDS